MYKIYKIFCIYDNKLKVAIGIDFGKSQTDFADIAKTKTKLATEMNKIEQKIETAFYGKMMAIPIEMNVQLEAVAIPDQFRPPRAELTMSIWSSRYIGKISSKIMDKVFEILKDNGFHYAIQVRK